MPGSAYVYIVTNRPRGVLYTGVTSDLERRIAEHKNRTVKGFTSRYNLDRLVWFEEAGSIAEAIVNEKKIKNRERAWKVALIEGLNPQWRDLAVWSEGADDGCAQGAPGGRDCVTDRGEAAMPGAAGTAPGST